MIKNKTEKVNLNRSNTIPHIILSAEGLKNPIHMMIDTGAGSNLIIQAVKTNVKINKYECLKLTGINEHPVFTLGQITINIFGYLTTLNIIPNEVPTEQDGILGTEFLRNNDAKINYAEKQLKINNEVYPFEMQETILVPARTISYFYVRIKNSEQKQGFIPQLHLYNGVYLGNAIVYNNNNKAYMKIFNTNTQPQKLTIPTVELIDFEELSIHEVKQTDTKTNSENRKEFNFSQQIFNDFINQIPEINYCDQSFNISNKNRENSIKRIIKIGSFKQRRKTTCFKFD